MPVTAQRNMSARACASGALRGKCSTKRPPRRREGWTDCSDLAMPMTRMRAAVAAATKSARKSAIVDARRAASESLGSSAAGTHSSRSSSTRAVRPPILPVPPCKCCEAECAVLAATAIAVAVAVAVAVASTTAKARAKRCLIAWIVFERGEEPVEDEEVAESRLCRETRTWCEGMSPQGR